METMVVKYVGEGETKVWEVDTGDKVTVKTGDLFLCRKSIGKTYINNNKLFVKATGTEEDEYTYGRGKQLAERTAKNAGEVEMLALASESCTDEVAVSYVDGKFTLEAKGAIIPNETSDKKGLKKAIEKFTASYHAKVKEMTVDADFDAEKIGLTEAEKEELLK